MLELCSQSGYESLTLFLQDIGVSKDLNERFREHLKTANISIEVDFTIQVLSSGSWPFNQSTSFNLPTEVSTVDIMPRSRFGLNLEIPFFVFQLERSVQTFNNFYATQHSGRKLNWLYNMCKGELVTNCFKNRYTLQVRIRVCLFALTRSINSFLPIRQVPSKWPSYFNSMTNSVCQCSNWKIIQVSWFFDQIFSNY